MLVDRALCYTDPLVVACNIQHISTPIEYQQSQLTCSAGRLAGDHTQTAFISTVFFLSVFQRTKYLPLKMLINTSKTLWVYILINL